MKKPTISVLSAAGLLDTIADAGANPDEILETVGVKRSILENPDAFIPTAAFTRTLEEAARATRDDCFGLHFGERFDPKDAGALAYVVFHSSTVALALRNVERYMKIHNSAARISFVVSSDRAELSYIVTDAPLSSKRQHNEYGTAVVLKIFRLIAGDDWHPIEIHLEHDSPIDTTEHNRLCRCPVRFRCSTNAVIVGRDFVERDVPHADPRLYRILKQHVERVLTEQPQPDDWLASVRNAIADAMLEGDPKRVRIARKLSISTRTLERRLKEHGVVYRGVVDDTRRQFALAYLKDRSHSLIEIAFLLGYSEVSAFHRAFRRWTGSTPSEYREQIGR
jgi:AraC-like DNA-binding protein